MSKVVATMAGTVLQVLVSTGEKISADQDVVVLESMKMEVPVASERAGTVTSINAQTGDFVNEGDTLLEVDEA